MKIKKGGNNPPHTTILNNKNYLTNTIINCILLLDKEMR